MQGVVIGGKRDSLPVQHKNLQPVLIFSIKLHGGRWEIFESSFHSNISHKIDAGVLSWDPLGGFYIHYLK
jgi:hypothetical protein